jgi:nitronate monooxygenase
MVLHIFYIAKANLNKALDYIKSGLTRLVKTPDDSVVFLSNDEAMQIKKDQVSCMGCLSFCRFSGWSDKEPYSTGLYPDVRSFCIQKTLQDVSHGGNIQKNLLFAGHSVYRFSKDEFYKNKFIPTISQLVERIKTGK